MIDNPSKIITIEDVVDILDISSKKTIYAYIQRGKSHNLSSVRVNDETNKFNKILYHLLNVTLFTDDYL